MCSLGVLCVARCVLIVRSVVLLGCVLIMCVPIFRSVARCVLIVRSVVCC